MTNELSHTTHQGIVFIRIPSLTIRRSKEIATEVLNQNCPEEKETAGWQGFKYTGQSHLCIARFCTEHITCTVHITTKAHPIISAAWPMSFPTALLKPQLGDSGQRHLQSFLHDQWAFPHNIRQITNDLSDPVLRQHRLMAQSKSFAKTKVERKS